MLYDFVDDTVTEEFSVGETKVIFREPTEQELPREEVPRNDGGFIGKNFFTDDGEWKNTVIGKSPNGAELCVTKRLGGMGYELRYNGGKLPTKLTGWFTSYDKAEEAARIYLAEMWDQARKQG